LAVCDVCSYPIAWILSSHSILWFYFCLPQPSILSLIMDEHDTFAETYAVDDILADEPACKCHLLFNTLDQTKIVLKAYSWPCLIC
jgi:hypothetical protein